MGDYTKTTWVEGVTQTGPTNLNKLEQGVADATKQASMDHNTTFDGTNATTNDKKRIVWRRSTDGSYLASVEAVDATGNPPGTRLAYLQAQARMDAMANSDQVRAILQAYGTGGAFPGRASVIANYMKNGRSSVWVEVKSEASSADPTLSPTILNELGYSDWARVTRNTYANRPAASTSNQNQFFYATDTKALYYNDDGTRWIQLAGPQEASTIVTPANGLFSNTYINYSGSLMRYWKDSLGFVHIIGEINSSGGGVLTANTLIFNLPAGYRPVQRHYFPVATNASPWIVPMKIDATGDMRVNDNNAWTSPYANLGHITFPTF